MERYTRKFEAKVRAKTLKFPLSQGDLKNLLKDDGYSSEAEDIMADYPNHFLATAYKEGNKIVLELNSY